MSQVITSAVVAHWGTAHDAGGPCEDVGSLLIRARWIKDVTAVGTLVGLALSPRLWLAYRDYPLSPIAPVLGNIPPFVAAILVLAFVAALIAILVIRQPHGAIVGALCIGAILVCLDQSRLQPWLYQYLLMLLAIRYSFLPGVDAVRCAKSVNACRLIVASIYIWSGIQKLNPDFAHHMFPWLITPFLNPFPAKVRELVMGAGVLAPFVEIAIGVGLLNNYLRKVAVFVAVAMHCLLLLALGPLGHNTNNVVWPWNVVMVALVIVLFARIPPLRIGAIVSLDGRGVQRFVLIAATIAPALSLFGAWDHYPSWALYSGVRNEAVIYVSDALFDRLPVGIQAYVYEDAGVNTLDIYEWSDGELNVPVYPEVRVYLGIARALCRYSAKPADVRLEVTRNLLLGRDRRKSAYDCSSPEVTSR